MLFITAVLVLLALVGGFAVDSLLFLLLIVAAVLLALQLTGRGMNL